MSPHCSEGILQPPPHPTPAPCVLGRLTMLPGCALVLERVSLEGGARLCSQELAYGRQRRGPGLRAWPGVQSQVWVWNWDRASSLEEEIQLLWGI